MRILRFFSFVFLLLFSLPLLARAQDSGTTLPAAPGDAVFQGFDHACSAAHGTIRYNSDGTRLCEGALLRPGSDNRPCSPELEGNLRYNSVEKEPEVCDGEKWKSIMAERNE